MDFESKNPFNDFPDDSEIIQKYKPQFITVGGEHLVYGIPDHPNIVIKVSCLKIADIVSESFANQYTTEASEKYVKNTYTDEIKLKNKEIRELRTHFGREHTLAERRYLMKVPISKGILEEIFKNDFKHRQLPPGAEYLTEVWTHVVVQRFTPLAQNPDRLSFSYGGPPEDGEVDPIKYSNITTQLVEQTNSKDFSKDDFLGLQDSSEGKYLSTILNRSIADESLKQTLIGFIREIIKYTQSTGRILALAGRDNIIFYKDHDEWTYLFIDAIPVATEPIFQTMLDFEEKLIRKETLTSREKELLKRGMNFLRVINGSAVFLGIGDRLILPPIYSTLDLLDIIRN